MEGQINKLDETDAALSIIWLLVLKDKPTHPWHQRPCALESLKAWKATLRKTKMQKWAPWLEDLSATQLSLIELMKVLDCKEMWDQQPYRVTMPLDDSCSDEQPAEILSPRIVNAVQPAAVTNPMIYAVQPAVTTNPIVDAVQPAAVTDTIIDAVQPAAMTNSICMADAMHHSPPCINPRYFEVNSEEIPGQG